MSVLYVYALCPSGCAQPNGVGLAGEALRLIDCGEVSAVVGEMLAGPELSAESLRAHDRQVREIASQARAVLPARFGTAVSSEAELQRLIEPRALRLREALRLVEDREQMTLRIFGTSPEVRSATGGGVGPGTAWLRARADRLRFPELDPLRRSLEGLVAAERIDRARPGSQMLGSVFHLIPRGRAEEYLARIESWKDPDLRAAPSGPWPTYAFANEALS